MAAENFKVKKGLEVGTAITATSSGVNVTGVVTATQFVGDGSGLTGVTGSGSGVVIKHDGSAIGTASTINFSTNLDVSAISAGIVTITASNSGISNVVEDTTPQLGGNLDLDGKFINGTGGANITGVVTATTGDFVNLDVDGETDLDDLSVAGVSTFVGIVTTSNDLFVGGDIGIKNANPTITFIDTDTTPNYRIIQNGGKLAIQDIDDSFAERFAINSLGRVIVNRDLDVDRNLEVTGISTFTGNIDANGNLDVDGQTDLDDVVVAGVSTFNDGITLGTNSTTFAAKFADDAVANFGTDNDLQISHDNSNALIRNSTGKVVVVGVVSATSGANITGVVTATTFSGSGASLTNLPSGQLSGALPALDGSALTGVTASGSGIVVKHDGTTVGTAGTINFSTNLDVTAVSAGIVTITASGGSGITTENVVTDSLVVSGISTFGNNINASGTSRFEIASMENGVLDGEISHNGDATTKIKFETSTIKLDTAGTTRLNINNSGVIVTGVATATSFSGSGIGLTSLNADNLGSGEIPSGRFPATLPAASGANLTSLNADNISSGTLASARIEDEAVTFAKMQHVGTGVFIGRNDSGSGDIETLTAAEARTLLNVADGATAGITTTDSNIQVTWTVTASGQNYRFTGPGNDGTENHPDLYLVRGQRYRFIHNATSSHPLQIQTTGGSVYTDGVVYSHTNNGGETRQGNNLDFNVQHDAPTALTYNCTSHGGMEGNIYIVGQYLQNGADNRVITATNAYQMIGEQSLIFDGSRLGIGLTPSGIALDISRNTQGGIRITDTAVTDASYEIRTQTGNSTKMFRIYDVSAGDDKFQISSAGQVKVTETTQSTTTTSGALVVSGGIGVAKNIICGGALEVQNNTLTVTSAAPNIVMAVPSGGLDSRIFNDGSGNFIIGHGTNSNTPTERLLITSDGDVGIGTNNPTASNITTSLSTNTKSLAVGIVTCNELYVSGIKVTSGGHYADLTAAAADGMSHYFPGSSSTSLISNLSASSTGSPVANQTADSYFNNYPYYDFYTGNANENGYIYTQTTAKWADGPFSIAFWVKPMASTLESESTFVQLGDHPAGTLRCLYTTSTDASRQIKTITIGDDASALNTAVLTTDWNHWVTTYDGSVTRYYLNGSLARSHTHSGTLDVGTGNKYIYVGYGYWNSSASNKASMSHMSDIGIWNAKELSAATITSIYNAKRTVVGY